MNYIKQLISFLFPNYCQSCERLLTDDDPHCFCQACWKKIKLIKDHYCKKCGKPVITARGICDQCRKSKFYYDRIRVAGIYDDILKQAIHLYKYSYRWKLISNFMDMIQKSIAKEYITDTDYIVPVPSTKMDIKKKGFNHTLFIAMNISKRYHVPYIKDLVKKTKETKPQSSLKRKERLQNLKDCFKFNKKYRNKLKNRNILLCDDVYTTGSTIQEVARELKKHGIRNIHVLTLARGL